MKLTRPRVPSSRCTPLAPIAPRLDRVAEVYEALVLGTSDYVRKNGFTEVLVGLSGGVDSSLVATIAADAVGPGRVHGVLMPSRFSSAGSIEDASSLVTNLGIGATTVPIEAAHGVLLEMLEPVLSAGDPSGGLAGENLQARIRGIILMAISNERGWLVLTTGNKSEMAVGYATLYGDMAGGYAVLKDVPKTLVYQLCEHRNSVAGHDLIPRAVISKPPSAELRPDQRDDDSLPPYAVLDPILEGYVERDLTVSGLVGAGFEAATVRRVIDLVDHAEYKRRQAPPGPRVTSRGFGKDRQDADHEPVPGVCRDGGVNGRCPLRSYGFGSGLERSLNLRGSSRHLAGVSPFVGPRLARQRCHGKDRGRPSLTPPLHLRSSNEAAQGSLTGAVWGSDGRTRMALPTRRSTTEQREAVPAEPTEAFVPWRKSELSATRRISSGCI